MSLRFDNNEFHERFARSAPCTGADAVLEALYARDFRKKRLKGVRVVGAARNMTREAFREYEKRSGHDRGPDGAARESDFRRFLNIPHSVMLCEPFILDFDDGTALEFHPGEGLSARMGWNLIPPSCTEGLNRPNFRPGLLFTSYFAGRSLQRIFLREESSAVRQYVCSGGRVESSQKEGSVVRYVFCFSPDETLTATSDGAAITSSDIQISVESYWGSSGLQPLIIGNSVLHCQRAGSHVRDLAYSWENDGYTGNDLSLLAPQLVESHVIRQWCFQQSPGSNVWCVRDDGTLLCLTYMKEQNVFGWSRHVTQGKVLSVATISGEQEDVVMLVVEREIGGAKKYFLERLAGRFKDNDAVESAFFVDCGVTKTFEEAVTEVTGLSHLEGCAVSVLADGAPEMSHTVQDGKITLLYPAKTVTVGLGYTSVLCPMPAEADMQTGSSLGKRRAYGKCVLRLHRSVGGSYADSRNGDLFRTEAWQERTFYDLPFLPDVYGQACRPFSGDMEITLPSGQDNDTTIWIKQDSPMPFRLVAVCADVDFGEQ